MRAAIGRRIFVGSVVAGVPLAAWKAGAFAQSDRANPHAHGAGDAPDPVLEHIARQIAVIHNAAQAVPRGEHLRALASQLRLLAVYGRQRDLDAQVRRALGDLVARHGRNGILFMPADARQQRETLERFGFRPEPRTQDRPVDPSYQAREAALDTLLHRGITPTFERLALVADRLAPRLDRSRAAIASVQDDTAWWNGYCAELWEQYQEATLIASPFCLAARYVPWAVPACAALEGGATIMMLVYFLQCVPYRY